MSETKKRKPRYTGNPNTRELHRLASATGACHLGADWPTFTSLANAARAGYADRCGHCNRAGAVKVAGKQEAE